MPVDAALTHGVRVGDARAVARALSLVEDETPSGRALCASLYHDGGRAFVIGVTGPPGAGKSTLVDGVIRLWRSAGSRVAVIAVDPTSPFTGGAILGDRVRMDTHVRDPAVFIRSMATRGHLGGLARATADAILIFDAAGFDVVIVETVGVGQDETEIVETADVCLVVLVPGTGDDVQAIKAGVMEIADIFVINKADRAGADRLAEAVAASLSLVAAQPGAWQPPIVKTVASDGTGLPELQAAVERYRAHAGAAVRDRRSRAQQRRLRAVTIERLMAHVDRAVPPEVLTQVLADLNARRIDPYSAADRLVAMALAAPAQPVEGSGS